MGQRRRTSDAPRPASPEQRAVNSHPDGDSVRLFPTKALPHTLVLRRAPAPSPPPPRMEAAAAGFATGARAAAAARPFGLDLQAAAGGVRRPRRAIPMPAAGPHGGHLPFATAPSTLYAAYGAEPRRPPRLEFGRVVTEFDSALTIDSHLVRVPVTRPSSMAPAGPCYEHLGCGRPVSLLPLRTRVDPLVPIIHAARPWDSEVNPAG
nr:uncharacterized protein LOC109747867 isoform X2 [Aegilops tauschii subsp. strangulata]